MGTTGGSPQGVTTRGDEWDVPEAAGATMCLGSLAANPTSSYTCRAPHPRGQWRLGRSHTGLAPGGIQRSVIFPHPEMIQGKPPFSWGILVLAGLGVGDTGSVSTSEHHHAELHNHLQPREGLRIL